MLHRRRAESFMILSRLKLSVACSTLLTFLLYVRQTNLWQKHLQILLRGNVPLPTQN